MEKKLNMNQIEELRNILIGELKNVKLENNEYIKLDLEPWILQYLIFESNGGRKTFAFNFNLIKKLDLTNISFDGFYIREYDFTGTHGVKINPQTVWLRIFDKTKLTDVEIIGSFCNCSIKGTDFTGSKGAKINPQTVWNRDFENTKLKDATIIGPFYDCYIKGTDFAGSRGTVIDPQTVRDKDLQDTVLTDACVINSFDDCIIKGMIVDGATIKIPFYKQDSYTNELKDKIKSSIRTRIRG